MRLSLAIPVLGALALFAALPEKAEARSRSSFDVNIGLGYSSGYRSGYYGGSSYRYSRGYHDYGYRHRPRYYHAPRVVVREYYRPVTRYYRDYDYGYSYRPVYRSPRSYYYDNEYYCD